MSNSYAKKAKKRGILSGFDAVADKTLATKGDWGQSGIETAKDLLIGAGGGAVLAAIVGGRLSIPVGILTSYSGYMTGSRVLTALGLGTMAFGAGNFEKGVEGTISEGIKGRLVALKEDVKYRLFFDKLLKSKLTESSTIVNGLGNVRYFVYPNENKGNLDMSALERIEQQVSDSAKQFQSQQSVPVNGNIKEMTAERIF